MVPVLLPARGNVRHPLLFVLRGMYPSWRLSLVVRDKVVYKPYRMPTLLYIQSITKQWVITESDIWSEPTVFPASATLLPVLTVWRGCYTPPRGKILRSLLLDPSTPEDPTHIEMHPRLRRPSWILGNMIVAKACWVTTLRSGVFVYKG